MARRKRNESPERQALREMMSGYLKDNPVRNGNDVNSITREMMSVILEGALDGELDEELGYSKCDYKDKDTANDRNGYSKKTMHTSYGDMEYPNEVRKIIYTTNNVECFNHKLGNITKNKGVFPTDDSHLKCCI